jgi:hypothetical protein
MHSGIDLKDTPRTRAPTAYSHLVFNFLGFHVAGFPRQEYFSAVSEIQQVRKKNHQTALLHSAAADFFAWGKYGNGKAAEICRRH